MTLSVTTAPHLWRNEMLLDCYVAHLSPFMIAIPIVKGFSLQPGAFLRAGVQDETFKTEWSLNGFHTRL